MHSLTELIITIPKHPEIEMEAVKSFRLQNKTIIPSEERQIIDPDEGYDAVKTTTVEAIQTEEQTIDISENGNYELDPSNIGIYIKKAAINVDVQPPLEDKTVEPQSSDIEYIPSANNYGFEKFKVKGVPTEHKSIDILENGITNIVRSSGKWIDEVDISVNVQPALQEKVVTPSGVQQEICADNPYYGMSKTIVQAVPTERKTVEISENGETNIMHSENKWIEDITIMTDVQPKLQSKRVTASTESDIDVVPDPDKDGLINVTVEKINIQARKEAIPSSITQHICPDAGYIGTAEVEVLPVPDETKTLTITKNGTTTLTPSVGKWISQADITVNVQSVKPKDYNFFDWDGKLVYSYTAAEINALTELPALPVHEGVSGKEWNYTLAQLQTLASLATPYPANVGAIYSAPDGYSTIIKIKIPDDDTIRDFRIKWTEQYTRNVTVNWGDNQTETIAASFVTANHTYSASGEYYITITPDANLDVIIIPTDSTFLGANARQKNYVKMVVLGKCYQSVSIGNTGSWFADLHNLEICSYGYNNSTYLPRYTFNRATSLKALHVPSWINGVGVSHVVATGVSVITVPYNCTTIQYEAFTSNPALTYFTYPYTMTSLTQRTIAYSNIRKLILPPNITTIVTGAYQNKNVAITELVLPQSLTTIEASAFAITDTGTYGMYISYLLIPTGVTSIGSDAFRARVIGVMDLRGRQTMPTLGNSAAVNNVRVFVVDDDAYDAAIVATNWATYASKFVKASDYNA